MQISDNGLVHHLESDEGVRYSVYRDSQGNLTEGVGHLVKQGEHFPAVMTSQQVNDLLRKDLVGFEAAINSHVKVKLTQNQYDSLVCFAFNIGIGGFLGSTTLRKLNLGDYAGAAQAMLLWNLPPEIKGRRIKDMNLFLTP